MTVNGYYVGLMSGTSLDGIDAVVIDIQDGSISCCSSLTSSWPEDISSALRDLIENSDSLNQTLKLDQLCAEQYAAASLECIQQVGLNPENIIAIGSHGQTIRHSPESSPAYSLQIGNPNTIAERTGITTIADFRNRDIAAGGQGAPFAPAFHQAVFHQPGKSRIVVNIGGIANITLLSNDRIIGYDTGPGNRLLDDWVRMCTGKFFDDQGNFAASGKIHEKLLERLLNDTFFKKAFPKSTGSDYFNLAWLNSRLADLHDEPAENIQATLTALTSKTIADQITSIAPDCTEVLVCGGGAHNLHLLEQLQKQLPDMPVVSTEKYGIHPDWVEAMAFAWLAHRTIAGLPGNLPSVTGASAPRICGGIYPGKTWGKQ
jgi:anhydro-N-acetylmuramic acid kinase